MSETRLYAHRDRKTLGEYYYNHVLHMTREGLHSKADIAAELAHRDKLIDELRRALEEAAEYLRLEHEYNPMAPLTNLNERCQKALGMFKL